MSARSRRIGLAAAAVTLAGLVVGVGTLVYEGRPTFLVALPPATATPEQVLRVYLRAAKAHDCATTEALSFSAADRGMAWCGHDFAPPWDDHADLVAYDGIGQVEHLSAQVAGGTAEDCIPVDITVKNMTGAEDGPMPGWQFCFAATPAGWRLFDEGYG